MWSSFSNDQIWFIVLLVELPERSCDINEFCFNKNFLSKLKVQCWNLFCICRLLISFLSCSDLVIEFLVKLVQVNSKFLSLVRSEIIFRMNRKGRIISLVGKSWWNVCSYLRSIIVSKLSERKKRFPVVLLVIVVYLNVLFQYLLCLTVDFRTIIRGEMKVHIKSFAERSKEIRNKFRTLIRGDITWNAMLWKDMDNKQHD